MQITTGLGTWAAVVALGWASIGCESDSSDPAGGEGEGADAAVVAPEADVEQSDAANPQDTDTDTDTDAAPTPEAPEGCLNFGTAGATALCLSPTMPPEHYVDEALRYFDTLDVDADPESVPQYSERVARWEWPPWLLLTGYEKDALIDSNLALKDLDPSTVPERDCRYFDVQPFARCRVVFEYEGGSCPIYEEFIFNDQGETTFIEAWSDFPEFLPFDAVADPWAEGPEIHRMGTKLPGLGNATGLIDLDSSWMTEASEADPEIADFVYRARDFWGTWAEEFLAADADFFEKGCGWSRRR